MNLLIVDTGSYSIKLLYFQQERKLFHLTDVQEIVIDEAREKYPTDLDPYTLKIEMIKDAFSEGIEGKIIMQVPPESVTSRYLSLPSTNKRKVDMMIPFQLDEGLPFAISEAHYITHAAKKVNTTSIQVNIMRLEEFDRLYSLYSEHKILPSVFTSELAVMQSYVAHHEVKGPAAILDIGHSTSKCYIAKDGEIVSGHINYTAGKTIDDVIAQTYQISPAEAVQYKHKNCFFLTDLEAQEISEEQKEFAKLMKRAIWPLILDVKRWFLGFRAKYKMPIEQVYLMGGSAQIHKIQDFLSHSLDVHVENLAMAHAIVDSDGLFGKKQTQYLLAAMMADTQNSKQKPGNFLFGPYANNQGEQLPLHSISFIGLRTLIICFLCSLFLLIEGFILEGKKDQIYSKVSKTIRLKEYGIPRNRQRDLRRRPERILDLLSKKAKSVSREVKAIKEVSGINAVAPLALISKRVGPMKEVKLSHFKSDGATVSAKFEAENEEALNKLKGNLEKFSLSNLKTNLSQEGLVLTLKVD